MSGNKDAFVSMAISGAIVALIDLALATPAQRINEDFSGMLGSPLSIVLLLAGGAWSCMRIEGWTFQGMFEKSEPHPVVFLGATAIAAIFIWMLAAVTMAFLNALSH